ncbi:MAG: thioesterase [Bacteroidetes bacterium HGW-Bacteroidetes-1]|jgi:predicted thioesterase|nr:MAG: thioesterase [Bacteroidetes bacterium HGW-Bacteroidetes-1]
MDSKIPMGLKGEQHLCVAEENTAINFGSGLVDVFATPAMVALMEMTALKSIHEYLPEQMTSVGTEVNIKHLKASPIGRQLRCESKVQEISGRKITFEVSVWDEELLVGHGTHTRYIVDKEKFLSKP